jgi:hypothetical protein
LAVRCKIQLIIIIIITIIIIIIIIIVVLENALPLHWMSHIIADIGKTLAQGTNEIYINPHLHWDAFLDNDLKRWASRCYYDEKTIFLVWKRCSHTKSWRRLIIFSCSSQLNEINLKAFSRGCVIYQYSVFNLFSPSTSTTYCINFKFNCW